MAKDAGAKIIGLAGVDPVFARLRIEAEELLRREPEFTGFIYGTVLNHDTLAAAVAHRIADRLDHQTVPGDLIEQTYRDVLSRDRINRSGHGGRSACRCRS